MLLFANYIWAIDGLNVLLNNGGYAVGNFGR